MTSYLTLFANCKVGSIRLPVFLISTRAVFRFLSGSAILMIIFPAMAQTAEVCSSSPNQIGVQYELQTQNLTTGAVTRRRMELWRDGHRVLHVYPDAGLAEQWEYLGKGALHLTTWFDNDARGIEYAPEDIGPLSEPKRWQEKWQLVSDNLIQSLRLTQTLGKACEETRILKKNTPDRQFVLEWNETLQLPVRYSIKSKDTNQSWVARKIITDSHTIRQVFERRAAYKTTDYIDIGDNESDPFLRKMIRLGFVSHGASGFYDSEGHALEGHGHSH